MIDESFQAISCTGTDNQEQEKEKTPKIKNNIPIYNKKTDKT